MKYFIDKCLPFGASVSCSHYQRFSNALKHLALYRIGNKEGKAITNYLDDFLFIAWLKGLCNDMIPVAEEKTVWASLQVVFLGILLNGQHLMLSIPIEK